jgi:hypothetical protein
MALSPAACGLAAAPISGCGTRGESGEPWAPDGHPTAFARDPAGERSGARSLRRDDPHRPPRCPVPR